MLLRALSLLFFLLTSLIFPFTRTLYLPTLGEKNKLMTLTCSRATHCPQHPFSPLTFLRNAGLVSAWGEKNDWAGEKGIFVTTFPSLLFQTLQVRQRVYPVLPYERSLCLRSLTTLILSSKYIPGRYLTIKDNTFCLCCIGISLPHLHSWTSLP